MVILKVMPKLVMSCGLVVGRRKNTINHKPQTTNPLGYTLIELLVVITVMGILALVIFSGSRSFAEDQESKKTVQDIQNFLRLAQSNATSVVKCGNLAGANWIVDFNTDKKTATLFCKTSSTTQIQKSRLEFSSNLTVQSISTGSCVALYPTYPVSIVYSPLFGKAEFLVARGITSLECSISAPLTITLINSKNSQTKQIIIDKGGGINIGN